MAEEEKERAGELSDVLALSESVDFKDRQEGVVGNLASPDELKRFTKLKRTEPKRYAMGLYVIHDIRAIEAWEDGREYDEPPMDNLLVEPDLHLRVSEDGFMVKIFKSVAHVTETSGASGGRKWWGGKR